MTSGELTPLKDPKRNPSLKDLTHSPKREKKKKQKQEKEKEIKYN